MRDTEVLFNLLVVLICIVIIGIVGWLFLAKGTLTGPNCPGKDPSWLGYCHSAPDTP